jgi:phosphotransferase system HPr (HPr) family protein
MPEIELTILNEVGLHARPASLFVQTASKFDSEIKVRYDGRTVNAKSILEILTLGAGEGAEITVSAEGIDADQVLKSLRLLVENDFSAEI